MTDQAPHATIRVRVAACIINDADEVLIAQHTKGAKNYWLFPGGGIRYGESFQTALCREMQEEATIHVGVDALLFVAESIREEERHVVHITFRAHILEGIPTAGIDPRVTALRWIPVTGLASVMFLPDVAEQLVDGWKSNRLMSPLYLPSTWKELPEPGSS